MSSVPGFTVAGAPPTGGIVNGQVIENTSGTCVNGTAVGNAVIEALPGPYYAITDMNGNYSLNLPIGTYTVNVITPPHMVHTCPSSGHVVNITGGTIENSRDFFLQRLNVTDIRGCVLTNPHRPGFNTTNVLRVENLGAAAATNTSVTVEIPALVTYVSANPAPTSINGNLLTWNLGSIPGAGRSDVNLTINTPINASVGGNIPYVSTVTTSAVDVDPQNDTCTVIVGLTASYDPNDKRVWTENNLNADGRISPTDSILRYHIRFQNTGTDTAFTVRLRDTMDLDLDLTTLSVENSSHPFYTIINNGNEYEWVFPNILLVDSTTNEPESHGHIIYTVKRKAGLSIGTTIDNAVGIYFDFNAPVQTNTVSSKICPPMTVDFSGNLANDTATFSDLSTGTITSWQWDFGDGNTSNQQNPTHIYGASGNFNVCLTVGDTCGSMTFCRIYNTACVIQSAFTSSTNQLSATFMDQSTSQNQITTYSWDFGDGNNSSLQNPSHTYGMPGTYPVCLVVMNGCGTDTAARRGDVLAWFLSARVLRQTVQQRARHS
ncbi:MAG: PKD domain-containing protein, partial [Bacteroidota bacterium]